MAPSENTDRPKLLQSLDDMIKQVKNDLDTIQAAVDDSMSDENLQALISVLDGVLEEYVECMTMEH